MTEAYGQRLGEALRVENAPAIVTRSLRTADIAVTEIRCDNPIPEMSGSIQQENAFLLALQLRDFPNREYWEDGRRASVCDLRAGESCLYDLKRDPTALLDKPYHSLAFYLPRAALDAIADGANAPRIRHLSYEPGAGVNDAAISGLAPWQERRAREILRANIKRGAALKEVARECGLSVGHFSHAFRRTLGVAPHKWLIEQRVALSKEKLRDGRSSLSDVAAECGFSDQSHLARHFQRIVGVSPGAWRRALME